ncbi:MAG: chemotaxis protein CheW [Isosphaeraceae bacterium]
MVHDPPSAADLAILPGLLVRIYEETYAIALDAVREIVEVKAADVRRIHGRATIEVRGRILSLIDLADIFRWGGRDHPQQGGADLPDRYTVVVAREQDSLIGLRVDELIDPEVVRNRSKGTSGRFAGSPARVSWGMGGFALVLDVDTLIGLVNDLDHAARGPGLPERRPETRRPG